MRLLYTNLNRMIIMSEVKYYNQNQGNCLARIIFLFDISFNLSLTETVSERVR